MPRQLWYRDWRYRTVTGTAIEPVERRDMAGADVLKYLGYHPDDVATRALVLLANRYQLDPLIGEIRIITPRTGGRTVYVTRDGMIAIAHRSGQLDGIVVDEERRSSLNDGWTAYVAVYRKDCTYPFRYGAQCKDTEAQAKAGNGPEMALARAERRALKRAFAIPADVVYDGEPDIEPVDGPDRYIRDESDSSGAEAAREVAGAQRSPEPPTRHEFIVATPEQRAEIRRLFDQLDLSRRDQRDQRLALVTAALGRDVTSSDDIDRAEATQLIDALRDEWYAAHPDEEPF